MLTRHLNANSHKARPHRGTEQLRHGKSVPQKTSQKTVACQQAPGMWLHRVEKKGKANSPVEKLAPNLLTKTKSSGESEPSQTKSG